MGSTILKFKTVFLMLVVSLSACMKSEEAEELECDCKDELYYYSSVGKVFLYDKFMNDRLFIAFDPKVRDAEIVRFVKKTGFFKPVYARNIIHTEWEGKKSFSLLFVTTKGQKQCSQLKEIIISLEKASIVDRADLVFRHNYTGSIMLTFSGFIYAGAKIDDLCDVNMLMQETSTWRSEQQTISSSSILFDVFFIGVNKKSKGYTLQMSHYFHETGIFTGVTPYPLYSEKTISIID